jgi:hypothetical protein
LVHAGDERQRFAPGFEARVWSPWPESVQRGWAPIFVELRNELELERSVELEASCSDWGAEREVRTSLRIAPGASAALEVLVPMGGVYNNAFVVLLRCDGESTYFGDTVGSGSPNPGYRQVLLLGEREPEAGAVERWSEALSTASIAGESTMIRVLGPGLTVTTSGAGTPSAPNDVDVAHAPFAGMPRHHAAYSSLDLVVLDPAGGLPSEAQLDALVAWVRTGGDLLVLGAEARAAAESVPALAAWMEPRFATKDPAGSAYRCGLGRLFVGEVACELGDAPCVAWVRAILDADASLTPKSGGWRWDRLMPAIPGLARLPYRTFAGLLTLFALVIGPVNFLIVRRRGQPVLLLLTIPAIALFTTAALLVYGILFQGVDVKCASRSVAVLDQRAHRSACVEARQFFAGLAPAAGLALGPGTIVHAMPPDGSHITRQRFEVALEPGPLLSGDFLPSRKATDQVLAVERAERARLDLRSDGGAWRVDNNLGAGVEALVVRDPEGVLHRVEGPLAPGASAALRRLDDVAAGVAALEALRGHPRALTPVGLPAEEVLPPGCYLARLAASPFRDDCGVETRELASEHLVLGVLAPEDWR